MSDFKYYLMRRKGDQAYPLIDILDEDSDSIEAQIGNPVPRKPVMADYLTGAGDFVTQRIAQAMQALDMQGVQFIPVEMSDRKGVIIEDYIFINVDNNTYEALDKEKSIYTKPGIMYYIEKVVLDRNVLQQIPLHQRLGFRLREAPGYSLYHESVVEEIKKLNPTGVTFVNIEEYEF